VAGLVVLVGGSAVVATRVLTAPDDRVPAGVTIDGIPVGGLSADEARRAVLASATPPTGAVVIERPGDSDFPVRVPYSRLAPTPRANQAVAEAVKDPSLFGRVLAEVGLESGRDVSLRWRATPARARAVGAGVAKRVDTRGRAATVRVAGGTVVTTPARAGEAVDTVALERRIASLPATATVPVAPVAPLVSDADAARARAQALRLTADAVTVVGAGRTAQISPAQLRGALRFPVTTAGIRVALDPARMSAAVRPTFAAILRPARSAGFRVSGDSVSVTASRPGRAIAAKRLATRILAHKGRADVRLPVTALAPARTTAQARSMRIRTLVSEFTTPYTCCPPRVTNLKRAAQILDGTIIPADARFSLNVALGERTTARGFVAAPQINAGKLEDAVGGGVSQMATTIFNAAFFAGLDLVQHTPHEFWITRYPPGREATVSWGGPELVVGNDWPAAILMKVSATDSGVTVRMYSSTLGRRVATTTEPSDPTAGTAFGVVYTRKVWRGATVRRDERWTWNYKAPPADE
jgi:vancomycin resistance protein YoaR